MKRRLWTYASSALLPVLLLLSAQPCWGEASPTHSTVVNPTTQQPPVKSDQATAAEKKPKHEGSSPRNKQKVVGQDTPDVFIPSEDISKDMAVAFPVDI